ncbi:MAG: hypothetical protein JZU70_00935 [Chlorobium sp.]|nr:hypothetical protein [Chlorobium sp.]
MHRIGHGTSEADWVIGTSGHDSIAAGAGDDMQYLPSSSANLMKKLDLQGVLHIGEGDTLTGALVADAYRITKISADSYQIQKMDTTGTTVLQAMLLNNAEAIGIGSSSSKLKLRYDNEAVHGTPWRDTISLNAHYQHAEQDLGIQRCRYPRA